MLKKTLTHVLVLTVITAVFMYVNAANADIVRDGLVSYWPLDEIVNGTVKDIAGKNDGTVEGEPELVEGKYGKALMFHGSPDVVTFGTEGFPTGADPMTLSAWFMREQSDAGGVQYIFGFGNWPIGETATRNFGVGTRGGDIVFMTQWGGEYDTLSVKVSLGEWHHVVAVHDDVAQKNIIYLDGVEVANKDVPDADVGDAGGSIGAEPGPGEYFAGGVIDEVGLYNIALTEAQAIQNYTQSPAVEPADKLSVTWGKIKASR